MNDVKGMMMPYPVQGAEWQESLHKAILNKDCQTVVNILKTESPGSQINSFYKEVTPLALAVKLGHQDICRTLLDYETTDIDQADPGRETALILAIKNNHTKIIDMLLERNADVNTPDPHGDIGSPLYYAVWRGYKDVVRKLIDAGANMDIGSIRGYSPIFMAARTGNLGIVKACVAYVRQEILEIPSVILQ